jgi:hypothetical protein
MGHDWTRLPTLEAGMKSLYLFRRALPTPSICRFIPTLSVHETLTSEVPYIARQFVANRGNIFSVRRGQSKPMDTVVLEQVRM